EKVKWKRISKISVIIIAVVIAELALITILVNLPLPGGSSDGISAGTLVKERLTTTDEAALGSRFQLFKPLITKFFDNPVIGSGFGTTVTYQTLDPRTKDINGGWYTSYSFEWGYLDIVIKIGLIGLLVYLYFIWLIIKDGIKLLKITKNKEEYLLILGLLFSLIALLITHISTPYINHPLGIFLIIISAAILNTLKVKTLE
ncbi:hypothetical protein KKF61_05120, partial [Patescibacteria group bacterium]|nr:hypothetical protein [Patescibacteria group bacterium]